MAAVIELYSVFLCAVGNFRDQECRYKCDELYIGTYSETRPLYMDCTTICTET